MSPHLALLMLNSALHLAMRTQTDNLTAAHNDAVQVQKQLGVSIACRLASQLMVCQHAVTI